MANRHDATCVSRYTPRMKLVFIHGAPAAGKLTTAKALLAQTSGRLFDNHAAIDVARTVFDFGTPGFWELVQTVRMSVLDAALAQDLPLLVMTFVYVDPLDLPTFAQFEEIVERRGGQLLPVYLKCSTEEIVRRIGTPDRAARRKMISETGVQQFIDQHAVSPVPRRNCLVLDSEANSAEANALAIKRHFCLS
ncbi:hypothetical protein [Bradyrhizobium sp. LTSPM299]|uniref:hypothetical protein n=1 Tax=Bradyrhizobium sp. LTSPM299 TaxID=1619233 RepID=UPI000AEFCA8C|nr:hypothetical protein [Bradyrhizobium sp. LTSPM299]